MSSVKNFLHCINNKFFVPTLEAMQELIACYHNENIDKDQLGCTLQILSEVCLQKLRKAKFSSFMKKNENLKKIKNQEENVDCLSIVFTQKVFE